LSNRSKFLVAAAFGIMCALPLTAQTASAQGMGQHGMGMHGSPFLSLLKSANLTSEQKAQVHQIMQSDAEPLRQLHQQFQALHEQIAQKLLSQGSVSASDLKPLMAQATQLQQQMEENTLDTALSIRSVLTPQQISKLAQVHQQLANMHKQLQNIMGSQTDETGD
jgi:Spy/CpxP family protein refolding chaperone